jgi:hypothetical protein
LARPESSGLRTVVAVKRGLGPQLALYAYLPVLSKDPFGALPLVEDPTLALAGEVEDNWHWFY